MAAASFVFLSEQGANGFRRPSFRGFAARNHRGEPRGGALIGHLTDNPPLLNSTIGAPRYVPRPNLLIRPVGNRYLDEWGFSGFCFANGHPFGRPSHFPSIGPTNNLRLMTRASLEPATYGLEERMLIIVLASLSSSKLCPQPRFRADGRSWTLVGNR